jgi:dTDP-4-dehydrorhamnose reductase
MPTRERRILLVGARGQLGSDLQALIGELHPAWTLKAPVRDELDLMLPMEPQLARFSLASNDVVINCGAFHDLPEVEKHPQTAFRVNAYAVRDLALHCSRASAHFVHFSTDYVFDGIDMSHSYREDDTTRPLNVYGASKLLGEAFASSSTPRATICRTASLFGATQSSTRGSNFVERIIEKARTGEALSVVSNRIMSPTYTKDVARAVLVAIEREAFGLYHIVNTGQASWWEFAVEIAKRAGLDASRVVARQDDIRTDAPPVRPLFTPLDNAKLVRETGHRMRDWTDALDAYLAAR